MRTQKFIAVPLALILLTSSISALADEGIVGAKLIPYPVEPEQRGAVPPAWTPYPIGGQAVCWRISEPQRGRWDTLCFPRRFMARCTENATEISCVPDKPVPAQEGT